MKDWLKRWLNINESLPKDFEDLAASTIEALAKAKDQHISDLRVLIDKAHEREAHLAKMVEMAMQHQFYRPVISGSRSSENKVVPALPPEAMTDVHVYDEVADAELIKAQERELSDLIAEQNEQGVNKVEA